MRILNKKSIPIFALLFALGAGLAWFLTQEPKRKIANELDGQLLSEGQKNKITLLQSLEVEVNSNSIDLTTGYPRTLCPPDSILTLVFSPEGLLVKGEHPRIEHEVRCTDENLSTMNERIVTPLRLFTNLHQQKEIMWEGGVLRSHDLPAMMEFPKDWFVREFRIEGGMPYSVNPFELEKIRPEGLRFSLR